MSLNDYFEKTNGTGVLSTADKQGKVNSALYARPHVVKEGELVFIMCDRLSHDNISVNPHAAYLFYEKGEGYRGKRFSLTKISEETGDAKLAAFRRKCTEAETGPNREKKFLVTFKINSERPLVGETE
ncbi:MAG: pyridoxamine 5'-phosphate oxidase family protein [Candidatus Omnitrophica bacterium]|nr:pyridoxamine 5'-phosphate oxidase family protein [Candidatus Omnitrophota bacterium]